MKHFVTYFLFIFLLNNFLLAQDHSLIKIWETDTILPVPESALFDAKNKFLYVSLMDGPPTERDGKGGVGKLAKDGKIIDLNWVTGLNAPKGMGKYKNKLFVADLTEIVIINIRLKKVIKKIKVDSAKVLNDVTIDDDGIVYVSDPRAGKVFKLENDFVSIYLDNLTRPNGLKAIGDYLYVLANGSLHKIDEQKNKQTLVTGMDENTDGLEPVNKGEYIVTCWTGVIYYVKENGEKQLLQDTRKAGYYSADIGYDPKKKIVYVPSLFKKTVAAYSLK